MLSAFKRWLYGRKGLQSFYKKMYTMSLGGMNYGNVDLSVNGEVWLLRELQLKNSDPVIIDVGANHGQYALACASVFGEKVNVHSFEPSHVAYQEAGKVLESFQNIRLNPFGLGSQPAENVSLHYEKEGGSGSSIFKKEIPNDHWKLNGEESIALRTLDEYCREQAIGKIDLLKIDTEGYEMEVLLGAKGLLSGGKIEMIQFEFSEGAIGAGNYFKDYFTMLEKNFHLYRLLPKGLQPILVYNLNLEVFIATNYVAIRKR